MWYIVVYSSIPQKKKVWNSVDDYTISINGILVKKKSIFAYGRQMSQYGIYLRDTR